MNGRAVDGGIDLTVVVVSRDTAALTERALAAIPAATHPYCAEAICVDNASADDTVGRLRRRLPWVRLVESRHNVGYGAGFNRALPLARGRHVAVLNADARPLPGALAHLVRFLDAHPRAGVAAPRVVGPDGTPQVIARPEPTLAVLLHETTLFDLVGVGRQGAVGWRRGLRTVQPVEVPTLVGVCLVGPTARWRALGGFDERYFHYWEDTDLCRRVRALGDGVWHVPDGPPVEHVGGGATPRHASAVHRWYVEGAVRYGRSTMSPLGGDAFAALVVLGFMLRAAWKGAALHGRGTLRQWRGRAPSARTTRARANAWLGVIEREAGALLRLLRRPTVRRAVAP